ncbi:MAG: phosphoglucosamine mutase [Pirellulaceae bacterium]|jgi:phosphomannomutase|nr:phosphoglucosamine mutase [Pirellulaceae bacterium]
MSGLIISVSGLRGVIGAELTPELAARFACAYAAGQPTGPLVLARDGRTTGRMLADAIRAAWLAVGRTVLDADVAATPTVGVLVRDQSAAGAIQVTASHNPAEYNGLKLFSSAGRVLSAEQGQQVVDRFRHGSIDWVDYRRVGVAQPLDDTCRAHVALLRGLVDAAPIRQRRPHVVLDANHGSGSILGRRLLDELGCRVTLLGGEPDGRFTHPPEPTAENLAGVGREIIAAGADVGFCQDPDADRLAVIDEHGRYIGEEYTLAICLNQVLAQRRGPVVTNCSTSRMAEDLAAQFGVPFFRAPVGEAHVVRVMQEQGAAFGGEGNGGPIDPQVGFIRDSFVAMTWILTAMAQRQLPVSRLADELPRYEICKTKQAVPPEVLPQACAALERHFSDAQRDRLDGLRFDWPGKWLLIRASNTEPIVRIVAESPTAAESQRLCHDAAHVIRQQLT